MTTKQAEEKNASPAALKGKSIAFFGLFSFWPSYHMAAPEYIAKTHGAIVRETVDEDLDYLVIGDRRGPGKSEAKKQAEKLRNAAEKAKKKGMSLKYPEIIDESAFRAMVQVDLTDKTFCFFGGFDCCGGELDEDLLSRMVTAVGGQVQKGIDENLDYLVMGNRRGEGKIAAGNQARKLQAAGSEMRILTENSFLELVRSDKPTAGECSDGTMDFAKFITQLHGTVNQAKIGRALKMLKSEVFKLYVRKTDEHVVGVVRSQTGSGNVYASWLTPDGKYGCGTSELVECMGLQGEVCKHLLVLIIGLTRAGEMDAETAYAWLKNAGGKRPRTDDSLVADTFIQYKGAEIGEIDWRPTETIPEDFYAY